MRSALGRLLPLVIVALLLAAGQFDPWAGTSLPPAGGVALIIMVVAGILWITEALPLFVTSLVILLLCLTWLQRALVADGVEVPAEAFTSVFFSDIILLFLGGFVLSAALHEYRLDYRVARAVIARTGHSVPLMLLGIMSITAFLSMWLSNTATAAMMLTLCLPIVGRIAADDPYRKAILLSVPFAANVGGLGTPIGSPPNAIAMEYLGRMGIQPGFATWMAAGVPLMVVLLVIIWGLLLMMYRGRATSVHIDPDEAPTDVLSWKRWIVLVVTLITAGGWLTARWHGLTVGTVALLPVIVLFGAGLLKVKHLRTISWDVLLVMGGGLCLGRAISVSGLADFMIALLPSDGTSATLLKVAACLLACGMSLVMSNTATANLIMPIIAGMSLAGVPSLLVAVAFSCTLAMALPISTPPNAIAFSSGELTVRDLMKPGLVITAIGLALVLVVGLRWFVVVGI